MNFQTTEVEGMAVDQSEASRDNADIADDMLEYYGADFEEWLAEQRFPQLEMYRLMTAKEKRDMAVRFVSVRTEDIMTEMLKVMAPRIQEFVGEGREGGVNYRDVNLFGRLVYGGVLNEDVLSARPTLLQVIEWGTKVIAAVQDKRQLNVDFLDLLSGAAAGRDQLVAADASINAVLATLVPLASRREVVVSAIYSLPRFAGLKRSVMHGHHWTAPSGAMFECERCPLTGAPIYFRDHEALQKELRKVTGVSVVVMPGSLAMATLISTILALRKPVWEMTNFRLDTLPTPPRCNSYWMTPKSTKMVMHLIQNIPIWANDYPPPTNLMGSERIAEYIHYLLYKVKENNPEAYNMPRDDQVAFWFEKIMVPSFREKMLAWSKVGNFDAYYGAVRETKAPINSLAGACQEVAIRRAAENFNVQLTDLLGSSTANSYHAEPRSANSIAKPGPCIRMLTTMGANPASVDYVGADPPCTALPALRAWAVERGQGFKIRTYGAMRSKQIVEEHTLWDPSMGYPNRSDVLYDDSADEGSKDLEARTSLKIAALRAAGYQGGIMKIYPTNAATISYRRGEGGVDIELPYHLSDLAKIYDKVTVMSPGRAHSPEFYVVFYGPIDRQRPPPITEVRGKVERMYIGLLLKTALMGCSNSFRAFIFEHAYPTTLTPRILDFKGHGPNLIEQARKLLGFGYEDTPGIYDYSQLVAEAKVVPRDEGVELMPNLVELAKTLRIDESFDPAAGIGIGKHGPTAMEEEEEVSDDPSAKGKEKKRKIGSEKPKGE